MLDGEKKHQRVLISRAITVFFYYDSHGAVTSRVRLFQTLLFPIPFYSSILSPDLLSSMVKIAVICAFQGQPDKSVAQHPLSLLGAVFLRLRHY